MKSNAVGKNMSAFFALNIGGFPRQPPIKLTYMHFIGVASQENDL